MHRTIRMRAALALAAAVAGLSAGDALAQQYPTKIIRVVNPETRQVRQARVIGVDEVEVLHGR